MNDTSLNTSADYSPEDTDLVQRLCLHLAVVLGNVMDDITVVGGLVPSLLIPANDAVIRERHVGTMDLDLGLALAILGDDEYKTIAERLHDANFQPALNPKDNPRNWKWHTGDMLPQKIEIDFLIQRKGLKKNRNVQILAKNFGALTTAGLQLAARDRLKISLDAATLHDPPQRAKRDIWICGPGAFMILKARALRDRDKNKDAYDIFYMLQHYGDGISGIADAIIPLLDDPDAREALDWLHKDYAEPDYVGPARTAAFLGDPRDENVKADAYGLMQELLLLLPYSPPT